MRLKKLSEKTSIKLKKIFLSLILLFLDNKETLLNLDLKKVLWFQEDKERQFKPKLQRLMERSRTSMLKLELPNLKSKLLVLKRLLLLLLKLLLKIEYKLRIERSELLCLKAKLPARLPIAQNKRWLHTLPQSTHRHLPQEEDLLQQQLLLDLEVEPIIIINREE